MSMEIYALSDVRLTSIAEWQRAIDGNGFPLKLSTERPITDIRGMLEIQVSGTRTGFECDHWHVQDVLDGYPEIEFGPLPQYCLAFRWGADLKACLGAYMAAAAYAVATKGVVFDCEQGKVLTPQEAVQVAQMTQAKLPVLEAQLRDITAKFARGP